MEKELRQKNMDREDSIILQTKELESLLWKGQD